MTHTIGWRERAASRTRSDSGDDLDPSLVHRLEPLGLLLGVLVWDGADGVVALAVLVDLAPGRSMMILSTSISVSARADQQQIGPLRSVLPLTTCFIPSFMLLGIVHAVVSAVFRLGCLASPGTCISLRVPAQRTFSLQDCVASGSLTSGAAQLLTRMIEAKLAFLISGGTGSGNPTQGLPHTISRPRQET